MRNLWVEFKDGEGKFLDRLSFWTEDCKGGLSRQPELRERFKAAVEQGAVIAGVKDDIQAHVPPLFRGTVAEVQAWLISLDTTCLGETQAVLGVGLDGEDVGSQYMPILPAKSVLSIISVEPPKMKKATDAELRAYAVELMTRYEGADLVLPKGSKVLVFHHSGSWMAFMDHYNLLPTSKLLKRLGSITKGFVFATSLHRKDVKMRLIEDLGIPGLKAKEVDGLTLLDRDWVVKEILKAEAPINIEAGLRKATLQYGEGSVPQSVVNGLIRVAERQRETKVRQALNNPLGSLRALNPDGPMIKSNGWLVRGLYKKYGCHILTSKENLKKDISGKGLAEMKWHFGYDPQKSHWSGTRSSTQAMIANPALFPVDQVQKWEEQEFYRLCRMLTSGQMEQDYLLSMEDDKRLREEIGEEVHSVLHTFRTAMESLLEAGRGFLDFRFAPYLCLDTFKALVSRMADPVKARISVPIPHSLSCQLISERLARLAGWKGEELAIDEITFWREQGVGIISNQGLEDALDDLGGADFDDHMHCMLIKEKSSGEMRIAVIRYPSDRGEYLLLRAKTPKDIELFKARKALKMEFDETDAVFTWTSEEVAVREVDTACFPERFSSRLATGKVVMVENKVLQETQEYPAGYTEEAARNLIEVGLLGYQAGLTVNVMMLQNLVGKDRSRCITRMEKVIDLMTQGGSVAAKEELHRLTEQMIVELLQDLMEDPSLPRIDRKYWDAKGLQLPVWCKDKELVQFIKDEKHLMQPGEGWISQLFATHEKMYAKIDKYLHRWLLVWQQEAPEVVAYLSTETKDEDREEGEEKTEKKKAKRIKRAAEHACAIQDAYTKNVNKLWEALREEGKKTQGRRKSPEERRSLDTARTRYVDAFTTMVQASHLGALFIPLRVQRGNLVYAGLYNDRQLWNGSLSGLVVEYYQGLLNKEGKKELEGSEERHRQRMPKLADCLSFRLIHMDVEHLTRWVQQLQGQSEAMYKYAIKCLWSLVDGTEFFVDQVEATVGKAFSEKELRGFKAYVTDKSDLKDTPLQLRKRLVAGCKDKAREVLTEIARQENEKSKEDDGGDWGGDIPSTPPTPPPAPPAPAAEDWVKETEVARDTDALEEMRIQEGTAPAPKAESLGEKLQALHQELDQAVLEHELAPSPKFTKFPQDWVRWLEKRLEGQEVHATVLKNMVQVSMERSYKEMKFHPSEERLDALEAELRKHYRMGVRGESDKDFEVFEEYQKEFTAGNAEMITDIQRGIISDWWGSHAFNHNIASEIVMPIADRVYREVVAEYQESLRERETKKETILSTPACQDVSLQEADAIITREGLKRPRIDALMAGSGLQTWTNLDGSITLVKVVDKEKGRKYWHDMKAKDPNWDLREGIQYLAK